MLVETWPGRGLRLGAPTNARDGLPKTSWRQR
jgi:hypothetical protein